MKQTFRESVARWMAIGAVLGTSALAACTGPAASLRIEVSSVVEQSGRKLIVRNVDRGEWRNVRILIHYPRGVPQAVSREVVRAAGTVKITLDPLRFSQLHEALRIEIRTYADVYPSQVNVARRAEVTYTIPPKATPAEPESARGEPRAQLGRTGSGGRAT